MHSIRELDRIEAIAPFEPGIPRRLARSDAAKKRLECFVQPSQGCLTARKVRCGEEGVGRACGLQLSRLFAIGHAALSKLPRLFAFGKRIVVEPPVRFEYGTHRCILLTGWVQSVFERFAQGLAPLLLLNVGLNGGSRDVTSAATIVASTPQRRQTALEARKLFTKHAGRVSFELVGEILWSVGWVCCNEQVNVIRYHLQLFNCHVQCSSLFVQEGFQPVGNLAIQHLAPIFRAPDEVIMQRMDATRMLCISCRTYVLSIAYHSMSITYLRETDSPALPLSPKGEPSPRRGNAVLALA